MKSIASTFLLLTILTGAAAPLDDAVRRAAESHGLLRPFATKPRAHHPQKSGGTSFANVPIFPAASANVL